MEEKEIDINAACEALGSALINCDNVKKLGPALIEVVKMQIRTALKAIGGDIYLDEQP